MVKLKLGAIIADASGKIGGQVVQRSGNELILKNNPVQKRQVTPRHQKQKAQTQYLMAQWSALTDVFRQNWSDVAATYSKNNFYVKNQPFTGFGLFQLCNQNRLNAGLSILLSPSAHHTPTPPNGLTVDIAQEFLNVSSQAYSSNDMVLIYATPKLSKGISKPRRFLKFITAVSGSVLSSGANILSQYLAVFPQYYDGQQIYLAIKTVSAISGFSNGQLVPLGEPTTIPTIPDPLELPTLISYWNNRTIDPSATAQNDVINFWSDETNGNTAAASGAARPLLHINSSGLREVNFNGSNQWLNIGQPSNLMFTPQSESFSIAVIIGEVVPTTGYIFANAGSSTATRPYALFIQPVSSDTGLGVYAGGTFYGYLHTGLLSAGDILIATFDTTTARLYYNGVQVASGAIGSSTTANDLNIGSRTNGSFLYDGSLGRIAVYSSVLTTDEINEIQNYYG